MSQRCEVCGGGLDFVHDHRADMSGIDDGPPLPLKTANAGKKPLLIADWKAGATLRELAAEYGVSHETARAWTEIESRRVGASRRPKVAA